MAISFRIHGRAGANSREFALRRTSFRPIEREYGSATSGASEAPPARRLFGTEKSRRENRRASPRVAEAGGQGEVEEAGRARERELTAGIEPGARPCAQNT